MKRFFVLIFIISSLYSQDKLLFYCGVTMSKAMQELANRFSQKYNCKIEIIKGGSQNLYNSLKISKRGDLYLPGSDSYIKKYNSYGFFKRSEFIGYNKAVLFVKKGNPNNIKNLDALLDENLSVVLGNPNSGSIGKMTKKILLKYKGQFFFEDVYDNASIIFVDSKDISKAIAFNEADLAINWKAARYGYEKYIDIVYIDEKYAPKKKLLLTELSFSKHKQLANKFIDFVISKEGKNIMKRYGF